MNTTVPLSSSANKVRVVYFSANNSQQWDEFIEKSPMGTLIHTRRFLSYHGLKFMDRSLMFFDAHGKLCAILPAAIDPDDPSCVISHPGATYGGLVLSVQKSEIEVFAIMSATREFLKREGFQKLIYKSVPIHLHTNFSQSDLYAVWRIGAALIRRDLWNVLDLSRPRRISSDRRRRVKRSAESGVKVIEDNSKQAYAEYFEVLSKCLEIRHGVSPVHTLDDMLLLHKRFPERISLWLALSPSGQCLSGNWIFDLGPACHLQYAAATHEGREASAQDLLLSTIMDYYSARGTRYFSFGASTEQQGRELNIGLFNYKASFGAGTVVQDFYQIDLIEGK